MKYHISWYDSKFATTLGICYTVLTVISRRYHHAAKFDKFTLILSLCSNLSCFFIIKRSCNSVKHQSSSIFRIILICVIQIYPNFNIFVRNYYYYYYYYYY
jgi:hypothetical protein